MRTKAIQVGNGHYVVVDYAERERPQVFGVFDSSDEAEEWAARFFGNEYAVCEVTEYEDSQSRSEDGAS